MREIGDYSLICSDNTIINENGVIIAKSGIFYSGRVIYKKNRFEKLIFANFVTGCTTLFKKELLKTALPFPDNIPYHDWWLALVASKQNSIKFLYKTLVLYRHHEGSETYIKKNNSLINRLNNITVYKKLQNIAKALLIQKNFPLTGNEEIILKDAIENYGLLMEYKFNVKTIKFLIKRFGVSAVREMFCQILFRERRFR